MVSPRSGMEGSPFRRNLLPRLPQAVSAKPPVMQAAKLRQEREDPAPALRLVGCSTQPTRGSGHDETASEEDLEGSGSGLRGRGNRRADGAGEAGPAEFGAKRNGSVIGIRAAAVPGAPAVVAGDERSLRDQPHDRHGQSSGAAAARDRE